ncbi:putative selenate reductase subunit YgfK [Salinivirga cyanobacteriivorans]
MSDRFHPISLQLLLNTMVNELEKQQSIYSLPAELFYAPEKQKNFQQKIFGQQLDSPLGVAAGPHSQLAQNIVGSWLMGARYIELKTVQTLDEIDVAKPCIDMQDEGYNCEWSQELKIKTSFNEYLNAWIAIHYLNKKFFGDKPLNTIFNMSVGYDLKGIMQDNVQWFFDKMNDCTVELAQKIETAKAEFPELADMEIPTRISDNITLSTMHGCPADEIQDIAQYLLTEKRLHTFIKLNPTLLGPDELRRILNQSSGFKSVIPDAAFEHDLKYNDALEIIRSLQKTADSEKLEFGLKLTNTLETQNFKDTFGGDVDMMYMSGRSLHPLSINIAKKLQNEFNGELQLSFSGGADAFNVADVLACGFKTVTVSSDLLKPGGYMRLNQYFDELHSRFNAVNAQNIETFIQKTAAKNDQIAAALKNLNQYADEVTADPRYHKTSIQDINIKTDRELNYFDCISAPCRDTCATNQDIPDYMHYTATGQFDKAYEVILRTNPFPAITGMVCDHLCQNKCTRANYDDPLLIREVKRFISEQDEVKLQPEAKNEKSVGIVGAGPAGLSAAYYLVMAGFKVEVFERNSKAGGMVQFAIPGFRLTDKAIAKDFKRVTDLGVKIHYNTPVDRVKFESIRSNFDYIFIGAGAQLSKPLKIEGIEAKGVIEPLQFLFSVKKGESHSAGKNIVIIGGGNTAMDAARTAWRVVGEKGKVTVVYRRTIDQMPADQGEIKAVLEEGIEVIELAGPEKVIVDNNKVKALRCAKMELQGKDSSGRPRPVKIEGGEFEVPCDTIIPAIGQDLDIDFMSGDLLKTENGTYQTGADNTFIGGDALRGASTAINAIGDGRKAAAEILEQAKQQFNIPKPQNGKSHSKRELTLKRARRQYAPQLKELHVNDRQNFKLVSETLDETTIRNEAERCLFCDEMCNICTTVCPNFANYSYDVEPVSWKLQKIKVDINGEIFYIDDETFAVNQKHQILNIANYCNECGNCSTFCPTNSAPYKDKPHIYLTRSSFNEADEGYYLEHKNGLNKLLFKNSGKTVSLTENDNQYIYDTDLLTAKINKHDFQITDATLKSKSSQEITLQKAAEMGIILKGAKALEYE